MAHLVHQTVKVRTIATALALAALAVPGGSQAGHCSKVIIFSGVAAGRGVNPGVGGCNDLAHFNSNIIVPGAQSAIVGWTGGRSNTPSGTLSIDGAQVALTGATWDTLNQRWTFSAVDLPVGPAALRATVSAGDGTQSVNYRKLI